MLDFLGRSEEAIFWEWFFDNKTKIEDFMDSDFSDYTIYHKLREKIKIYNSILIPELTKEENKFVLIISPGGIKEGIEPTKKLYKNRPKLENWIIKKYRQPSDKILLNFEGIEYPSNHIEIIAEFNQEEKVDIKVFIKNMDKDERRYKTLAFLYLDHILGEFNTIMKVRYIDFLHLDEDKSVINSISLLELRKLIEVNLY